MESLTLNDQPAGVLAHTLDDDTTEAQSVVSLIRRLQSGETASKLVTVEDRRRCVEHLAVEGYSLVETAEVLQVTERTIARDRAAIRAENAVERDSALVGQMVGQIVHQADACVARIRQATRGRDTPVAARIDGERACWTITKELTERLQSLGYRPPAPETIRVNVADPASAALQPAQQRGAIGVRLT